MAVDLAGRRATRIAKVFLDVTWWIGVALAVIALALYLTAPLLMQRPAFVTHFDWNAFEVDGGNGLPGVRLQVAVAPDSTLSSRLLASPDTTRASNPVLETQPRTHLEFGTRRWGFFYLANATFLLIMAAMLFGVHLLRSFLKDVLAADVFTIRNATRLSTLGWLVIAFGIAGPQLEYWRAKWILARAQLDGAALSPASSDSSGLWLVGVLLLVLAAAWRYGAELQQERDLTV